MQNLLTTKQVALITSLSVSTLRKMRMSGNTEGPRFVKLNRRCAYRHEDVEAFIAARLRGGARQSAAE
jgi:predicted DNA-binding transcriptional regulator AlpA